MVLVDGIVLSVRSMTQDLQASFHSGLQEARGPQIELHKIGWSAGLPTGLKSRRTLLLNISLVRSLGSL
eukprot:3272078-Amphidinium_carterae.1